jgi:hypothetical protein
VEDEKQEKEEVRDGLALRHPEGAEEEVEKLQCGDDENYNQWSLKSLGAHDAMRLVCAPHSFKRIARFDGERKQIEDALISVAEDV